MRSGAYVVMEALVREGVDTIFGYPGGVVLPLYDEMLNWPQVKHVLVRHEQGGAHMAEGYAKATGRVGVCLATSGPGATNLVTGIADAMMDSVPMVAITGNVNTWAIGKDAFQEVDIQGVTIPITKHNYLVTNVDELPGVLAEAFYLARTGRKGPVLVDIPKDVFQAMTSVEFPASIERRGYKVPGAPSMAQVEAAAALINAAERPVMIAGAGALWSEAFDALLSLAQKTNIPVINSLHGLGVFPRDHELSLGMMGMHGEAVGTLAVQECDLLIGLGMRFDDRLTGATKSFAPKAKIVHFEIDPSEIDKTMATAAPVQGDLRQGLEMLLPLVEARPRSAWNERVSCWQKEFPLVVPEGRFFARTAIKALNDHTGGNAVVATDVGQHQMWTAQFYKFRKPFNWISSGGLGTMGFGLPAAIGAKCARPDAEVWCVCGDGGFQMTLQELQTAVEYGVNVKIMLVNNGYLGMVRQWQELFYDNRYSSVAMGAPDFGLIAQAYRMKYVRCERYEDMDAMMEEARAHEGPVLFECVVEMEENVYPMVPAGGSNSSLMMDPALAVMANALKEEVAA